MGWLSIIGTIGDLISKLAAWWHDRQVKNEQQTEDQRDQAVAGLSEIQKAGQAGDSISGQFASDPSRVRQPDGHTSARGGDGIS